MPESTPSEVPAPDPTPADPLSAAPPERAAAPLPRRGRRRLAWAPGPWGCCWPCSASPRRWPARPPAVRPPERASPPGATGRAGRGRAPRHLSRRRLRRPLQQRPGHRRPYRQRYRQRLGTGQSAAAHHPALRPPATARSSAEAALLADDSHYRQELATGEQLLGPGFAAWAARALDDTADQAAFAAAGSGFTASDRPPALIPWRADNGAGVGAVQRFARAGADGASVGTAPRRRCPGRAGRRRPARPPGRRGPIGPAGPRPAAQDRARESPRPGRRCGPPMPKGRARSGHGGAPRPWRRAPMVRPQHCSE
ncbi:hypothetical protein GXW82_24610 [Streptacidiphilus sp. 4-A2]|nr:hypothetical protein [Streptacidiphilus sp. 4-A2]